MYVTLFDFELLLLNRVNWLSSLPGSKGLLHCNCIFVELLLGAGTKVMCLTFLISCDRSENHEQCH